MKLVFDIETIGQDFAKLDKTTQEVLLRWIKKESLSQREYRAEVKQIKEGLGFSPLTGEIVAIGVLDVEKNKGAVYYQSPNKKQKDSEKKGIKFKAMNEKQMLKGFWQGVKNYTQVIGFNSRSFDVPFIMVRSAIHKIRSSINLMPYRYAANTNHIDLLDQLTYYGAVRKKGSLHLWCRAFGIESPKAQGVTGDDVAGLFKEKKFKKIAEYNVRDLYATKKLYEYWDKFLRF